MYVYNNLFFSIHPGWFVAAAAAAEDVMVQWSLLDSVARQISDGRVVFGVVPEQRENVVGSPVPIVMMMTTTTTECLHSPTHPSFEMRRRNRDNRSSRRKDEQVTWWSWWWSSHAWIRFSSPRDCRRLTSSMFYVLFLFILSSHRVVVCVSLLITSLCSLS